jgi:hypothetical protein
MLYRHPKIRAHGHNHAILCKIVRRKCSVLKFEKRITSAKSAIKTNAMNSTPQRKSRLGGVVVSVLASGPQSTRVRSRPRRWIFNGVKSPHHTLLLDEK